MKPPSRKRSAPSRYDLASKNDVWTEREKRRLLQGLNAQARVPGPLRPELLKKYLPGREEAEIVEFVNLLKERVAKEAVKAQCQYRQPKQKDAPLLAPIEVWTELAEKLTGHLEDAVTAAFSQVLTIASAEPLSLHHSLPPKSVKGKNSRCSSPTVQNKDGKSGEESQESQVSSNAEEPASVENKEFHVDFEKIYKYLSTISRGFKAPELPPGESAVLLDLLLSLPEELNYLDFKKINSHMRKHYMELHASYKNEKSRTQAEASQPENNVEEVHDTFLHMGPATNCPQQQEGGSSVACSKEGTPVPSAVDWKALGICPLNSFTFPLDILVRKNKELD
ncbi:hypothetical protein JRQ81_015042 [Phrynocephalus forsythii]|uniref:snRNA-activating protein complex subunit 2 n=1 Tax=Phrynocephalus forsythii TaxID=171643 RepID=A0A9Q0Y131_9SAUR|nr:hypothetical protein JRQ81_015042 [Phrynocephalus forsythii]